MTKIVKVGILKAGCIGTLPLIEFLLDERADRTDVDVLVAGSGAKLGLKQCELMTEWLTSQKPDLIVSIGPAQHTSGPKRAREMLAEANIPTIIISDGPARSIIKELESAGFGYIILDADAMIGARREFLDPIEMALFNSDMIRILAITGVLQVLVNEFDALIHTVKKGEKLKLPHLMVSKEMAVDYSSLHNPYAKAKAMAAYEIATRAARVDADACFRIHEWTRYVSLVASGHEMIRIAAKLVDDAREMDKTEDAVVRKPHFVDGSVGVKKKLIEKPKMIEDEK